VVYALTQTFVPNLILYYAVSNLVVFVMAQVEAQDRFGLKQSLYVKHDIYRFMFMSALFFGMSAIAHLFSSNFKMLVAFLLSLKFLLSAIRAYNESRLTSAVNNLMGMGMVLAGCEVLFLFVPFGPGEGP
jgi:hypothetical protein